MGDGLCRQRTNDRRAHGDLDPGNRRLFRLPARHDLLGVVRADPALEEARRDRELHGLALDGLEVHARKPARVDFVADLGAKACSYPRPVFLLDARHVGRLCLIDKTDWWKRNQRTRTLTGALQPNAGQDLNAGTRGLRGRREDMRQQGSDLRASGGVSHRPPGWPQYRHDSPLSIAAAFLRGLCTLSDLTKYFRIASCRCVLQI